MTIENTLGDIAILSGGTVFTEELDIKPENATIEQLGSAGAVTITKEDTVLLNGEGSKDNLEARCEQIRSVIADVHTTEYEKEKLQERLAKLSGGVAVIKVGGASEVEVGEKKDRYEDALNATRAAVEEGILPGGGTALIKATKILDEVKEKPLISIKIGVDTIRAAITKPAKRIIENAGEEGAVMLVRFMMNQNLTKVMILKKVNSPI